MKLLYYWMIQCFLGETIFLQLLCRELGFGKWKIHKQENKESWETQGELRGTHRYKGSVGRNKGQSSCVHTMASFLPVDQPRKMETYCRGESDSIIWRRSHVLEKVYWTPQRTILWPKDSSDLSPENTQMWWGNEAREMCRGVYVLEICTCLVLAKVKFDGDLEPLQSLCTCLFSLLRAPEEVIVNLECPKGWNSGKGCA